MRHAIFTIVQDEPFFFPIWYRYYRDHYPSRHMYVLYHPLPDEESCHPEWVHNTLGRADTNLVRIFRDESFNHTWLRKQVERFAAFLLGSYDTVTFTEVDEIITLDPAKTDERNLLVWLDDWYCREQPAARCNGYEVVHRFGEEPNLLPDSVWQMSDPVLKDRGWWYPSSIYSKTLIWRALPHWDNGFHQARVYFGDATGRFAPLDLPKEPELLLLHLHKVDYQMAAERLRRTAARNWSETDLQGRVGIQNRFKDENQLREWWYQSIDNPTTAAPLVPMPEALRTIV